MMSFTLGGSWVEIFCEFQYKERDVILSPFLFWWLEIEEINTNGELGKNQRYGKDQFLEEAKLHTIHYLFISVSTTQKIEQWDYSNEVLTLQVNFFLGYSCLIQWLAIKNIAVVGD